MTHPDQDIIDFLTKDLDLRATPDWMIERARAFRDGEMPQRRDEALMQLADASIAIAAGKLEWADVAVEAARRFLNGQAPLPNPPKDTEQ